MSHAGEKTEAPTPRRRREARRRGQVARSADLTAALILLGGGLALGGLLPGAAARLLALGRRLWADPTLSPVAAGAEALEAAARAAGPLAVLLAGLAAVLAFAQVGPLLAPEAVRPDLGRLDPAKGLRHLISFQRLGVLPKAAVAVAVALFLLRAGVRIHGADVLGLPLAPAGAPGAVLFALLPRLLVDAGAALLALGVVDLLLARRRLDKELRMTRREVEEERKSQEGSPEHKGRRRQVHRALVAAPPRRLVDAAAVVVNPTRIAVALHFDDALDVPEVGVRGVGADAARMRAEARRLGLPVVKDVPLARALLALDPGEAVPEPLYAAVAAVLAAVHRARRASGSRP